MKVIHIESGLGNQMLSYCEYIAMQQANPTDECYVETLVYDIPECSEVICQWNGYELPRIFGIDAPNVSERLSPSDWERVVASVKASRFWEKNWNYPVYVCQALREVGIDIDNLRGDFETPGSQRMTTTGIPRWQKTMWFQYLNLLRRRLLHIEHPHPAMPDLFIHSDRNIFTGQQLTFKNVGSGIERIDSEVRRAFTFPPFSDERNSRAAAEMQAVESVAIHTRRGDMLSYNFDCYYGGYFKRCMSYLKRTLASPRFYIFCDTGSIDWARHNGRLLGLDFRSDKVSFIDWNKGADSWRDMQLMAQCKHQVITRSSFGWWGAYLNSNPGKITCSPDTTCNTTHHF